MCRFNSLKSCKETFSVPSCKPLHLFSRFTAFLITDRLTALLYFPDFSAHQIILQVTDRILGLDFFDLLVYGFVVGRSIHIADHTESDWHIPAHHGKHHVQGVILFMCIMYQNIIQRITILTDRYGFKFQAFQQIPFSLSLPNNIFSPWRKKIVRSARNSLSTIFL